MSVATQFPATETFGGTETDTWVSPENVHADDGINATFAGWSLAPSELRTLGNYYWGTFGFDSALPGGATITQVVVEWEWNYASAGGQVPTSSAALYVSGALAAFTGQYDTTGVTSEDVTSQRAWVRADFLDAVFEAKAIVTQIDDGSGGGSVTDVTLDYVKVIVTYTSGTPSLKHGPTVIRRQSIFRGANF